MDSQPISVVIPAFNAGAFLPAAVAIRTEPELWKL